MISAVDKGPKCGSRDEAEEERRHAAHEVALLPNIVRPQPLRPSRNVPSVHELLELDRDGGCLGAAAAAAAESQAAKAAAKAQALEGRPGTSYASSPVSSPASDEEAMCPALWEVGGSHLEATILPGRVWRSSEDPRSHSDESHSGDDPDSEGAVAPHLRLLQPRRTWGGELTSSAFNGEDSLAYSMEDSSQAPELSWDRSQELHSADLNSEGLLCDSFWSGGDRGETAEPTQLPQVAEAVPQMDGAGAVPGTVELRAKLTKLTTQISRLHRDVEKDVDAAGRRGVWQELYQLFRAKMAIDLTDEDQIEIERYVFEQLPTESTDLIWKVYKVLHLEQELDRCQRRLTSLVSDSIS